MSRPNNSTSPLGLVLQVLGVGALLFGVYAIYPPAAYILGGVGAVIVGERL